MVEVFERALAKGRAEGRAEGEERLSTLIQKLLAHGRDEDMKRCLTDQDFRQELYQEFGMM